ncbi:peptidoglycan editing factor PgeF [Mitsuaria sp. GD03876]|uniref:peptidoglycan editing factor PgeF n=1 Tax=Mitsuaria sp. GD03876 TaxID=2975399 RepID=UPI00244CEE90|nr:peptidoglycan editing factor PgeF [Mitsuaria sp. GD03876]MDH0864351.1 peptidoglycan editing factor PgeF [Mitsuaria sp. GD03876]
MTTRAGGVSGGPQAPADQQGLTSLNLGRSVGDEPANVAENRRRVAAAIGATPVFLKQVHGTTVLHLRADHALPGADPEPADASISTDPSLACAVMVADCLPVLFAGPGVVGAAHAGWRGLAGGVLRHTVDAMCDAAFCAPDELQAWMGACIGPARFEVGADVLAAFGAEPLERDQPLFRFQPNEQGEPRWRADLYGLARQRLEAAGVGAVSGGGWCTVGEPSRFFSFRHERVSGLRSGRMAAVIRLR